MSVPVRSRLRVQRGEQLFSSFVLYSRRARINGGGVAELSALGWWIALQSFALEKYLFLKTSFRSAISQ